jgi:hypothetical protein
MTEIEALKGVIKKLHGVNGEHVASVPVHETFQGQTVWQGEVELFSISGHLSGATICYGWAYQDDAGKTQYTTVLNVPPVKTAQDAVRAALVAQVRNERKET